MPSRPVRGERIPLRDLFYMRGRSKDLAHSTLLKAMNRSGITRAELARMLGKKPSQITRWLSGPGNLTLESMSDLIFAATGETVLVRLLDELDAAPSNRRAPDWLRLPNRPEKTTDTGSPVRSSGASTHPAYTIRLENKPGSTVSATPSTPELSLQS